MAVNFTTEVMCETLQRLQKIKGSKSNALATAAITILSGMGGWLHPHTNETHAELIRGRLLAYDLWFDLNFRVHNALRDEHDVRGS